MMASWLMRTNHNLKVGSVDGIDKIEKNEMGGTCSTYGEREMCVHGFGGET
jgi:hypothetical protein